MKNTNDREPVKAEFSTDYIDRLFSRDSAEESAAPESAPEVPQSSAAEERSTVRKLPPRKVLAILLAIAATALIMFLVFSNRNPFAGISDDKWVAICRDTYNRLYTEESLHFTKNTVQSNAISTITTSSETWFSGESFYREETDFSGRQWAYLAKDGDYYCNSYRKMSANKWSRAEDRPAFVRSTGAWEDTAYTLEKLERNGDEMEVVFIADNSAEALGIMYRVFRLRFRFDRDLQLKAIVYTEDVRTGAESDPEQRKATFTDEYIFHSSAKADIEAVIDATVHRMEEYDLESKTWHAAAAAAYDALCSSTMLHYSYELIGIPVGYDNEFKYNFWRAQLKEGWFNGTDHVIITQESNRYSRFSVEKIEVQKGDDEFAYILTPHDLGHTLRSDSTHPWYGDTWDASRYTFCSASASDTSTDITFCSKNTSQNFDIIVLHLDGEGSLRKITVSQFDKITDTEPRNVTVHQFYDTSGEEIDGIIDTYYQMALSKK